MGYFVRLACLRHAASVHPEPGSNSPKKINIIVCYLCFELNVLTNFKWIDILLSFQRSFSFFTNYKNARMCSLNQHVLNISNIFDIVNTFLTFFQIYFNIFPLEFLFPFSRARLIYQRCLWMSTLFFYFVLISVKN